MKTKPICHRDGSVTYWATYAQVWRHHVGYVPDYELASMPANERQRIINHFLRTPERLTR